MKRILFFLLIAAICSACGKAQDNPDEPVQNEPAQDESGSVYGESTENNKIATDGCYIVYIIGSHEMTVYDTKSGGSMNTYDLDDMEHGEWISTSGFAMCHYDEYQYVSTSPENWYLIKPIAEDYQIVLDSYNVYRITFNEKEYDEHKDERFVLTPDGVTYMPDISDKYSNAYLSGNRELFEESVECLEAPVENDEDAYALVYHLLGFPRGREELKFGRSEHWDGSESFYDFTIMHDGYPVYGIDIRLFAYTGGVMDGKAELRHIGSDCIYLEMPEYDTDEVLSAAGVKGYTQIQTVYFYDKDTNTSSPCLMCDSKDMFEDTLYVDIIRKEIVGRRTNVFY